MAKHARSGRAQLRASGVVVDVVRILLAASQETNHIVNPIRREVMTARNTSLSTAIRKLGRN